MSKKLIFLPRANVTNVKHGLLFTLAVKHVKLIASNALLFQKQ